MNAVAKKAETKIEDDGKAEYRVTGGKFSTGRSKDKVTKVAGDVVRLTPLQAKNFADVMEKVSPPPPTAESTAEAG